MAPTAEEKALRADAYLSRDVRGILADWYEERSDLRAEFWRWVFLEGKEPYEWAEYKTPKDDESSYLDQFAWACKVKKCPGLLPPPAIIPENIWRALTGFVKHGRGVYWVRYKTLIGAWKGLERAWLQINKEKTNVETSVPLPSDSGP